MFEVFTTYRNAEGVACMESNTYARFASLAAAKAYALTLDRAIVRPVRT